MRPNTLLAFVSAAAIAVLATGAPTVQAQATGKITGKISFKGVAPLPIKIRMSADPRCMQANPNGVERKQVDGVNGGLANVVVSIKTPVKGTAAPKTTPVLLDQSGCMYTPAAIALQVGQPLRIRNSDDTLHNVHPRPLVNAGFNVGQPRKGMETEKKFDKAETIFPVSCDVHPWMRSYIAVFDHPFFTISKEDGTFEIPNVPPGEYEIEATHPTLKTMTGKVVVKAGAAGVVDLTFILK
ncbi:MAG: carboxypeptidase regulatory-like domain-containing protein [Vicinamibacteria bacterium]